MPLTYEKPPLPEGVKPFNLVPSDLKAQELGPKTRVVCINRGRETYVDKFDGRDYVVPPGLFEVEYEAADHFRNRSVVPGSRDPVTGFQDVFIAILGLDPAEKCQPFTDEECARYGVAVEALDRAHMDSAADRDVKVVSTSAARARVVGRGRRSGPEVESNDGKTPAPADVMTPPAGGDAALAGRRRDAADDA